MKETAAEEEEEREWRSDAVEKITEEEEKQKSLRRNFESPAYTHFSSSPPPGWYHIVMLLLLFAVVVLVSVCLRRPQCGWERGEGGIYFNSETAREEKIFCECVFLPLPMDPKEERYFDRAWHFAFSSSSCLDRKSPLKAIVLLL